MEIMWGLSEILVLHIVSVVEFPGFEETLFSAIKKIKISFHSPQLYFFKLPVPESFLKLSNWAGSG